VDVVVMPEPARGSAGYGKGGKGDAGLGQWVLPPSDFRTEQLDAFLGR